MSKFLHGFLSDGSQIGYINAFNKWRNLCAVQKPKNSKLVKHSSVIYQN